jgi:PAXNEB protein
MLRLQLAISESNQPRVFCVVSCDLTTSEANTETSSNDFFIADTLEKSLVAMRAAIVKFLSSQNERPGFERKVARDSSIESVTSVSRIFLPQLLNIPANYGFSSESARLIVQFLLGIKQLIRNYHATVAFTLPPHACSSALVQRLKWISDTVLSVESFAGREQSVPYEFKEFCGLLTIERLQQEGSIASFRPPGSRFGIKRDSRKLHIEPLHLPPEETRTGTSGTAAAAAFAAKDGYAVLPTPDLAGTDGKARIEIKMDHSAPPAAEVNKRSANDSKFAEKSFTDTMSSLAIKSPSKYLEKGLADDVEPKVGNAAARSIFARARAEGLLPQAHQLKKAEPPLTPGSACAPNRPGTNTSASLDF